MNIVRAFLQGSSPRRPKGGRGELPFAFQPQREVSGNHHAFRIDGHKGGASLKKRELSCSCVLSVVAS